jgi:chemotaxis protein CheD
VKGYVIRQARGATHAAAPCWGSLRFYDSKHQRDSIKILPGEYHVTSDDIILMTVLGSCVAVCLRDPLLKIGGMNHFMLPKDGPTSVATDAAGRYGTHAMELLINGMLKAGASRNRLQAKLFGGGAVLGGMNGMGVGRNNIDFARAFLAAERIEVLAADLGGNSGRKIMFFPCTGRVLVKTLRPADSRESVEHEALYQSRLRQTPLRGEVELFD